MPTPVTCSASAARLGVADQRERGLVARGVDALALRGELVEHDVEGGEHLVGGGIGRRRARFEARAVVELERAPARPHGVGRERAEALDAGGARRVAELRGVFPAESLVQAGEQAAEKGVAGAGGVDGVDARRGDRALEAVRRDRAAGGAVGHDDGSIAEALAQAARELERRRPSVTPHSSSAARFEGFSRSAAREHRVQRLLVAEARHGFGRRHVEIDGGLHAGRARDA